MCKGDVFVYRNENDCRMQALWTQASHGWRGDHRRSLVETMLHCIKQLGERLMSPGFEPDSSMS